jgi:hypothetical protein
MPLALKAHKRAQKDVDAKWTRKHCKNYFGYELHASIDKRHKLVRTVIITNATVSDSVVFEALLKPNNTSRNVQQQNRTHIVRGIPTACLITRKRGDSGWP